MKIDIYEGFVELVDVFGDDCSIVNAARVSFGAQTEEFTDKDAKLMSYLWEHEHTSPFRMASIKFRVKAPIFVLRQWMKHVIGCSWNEVSGRYVEIKEEFFRPDIWRLQHPTSKQSSYGHVETNIELEAFDRLNESYKVCYQNYKWMLSQGICREQARVQLPLGMYSSCIWKADLQAIMHFLALRLDEHAQEEIREFAGAVKEITAFLFPESMKLLDKSIFIKKQLETVKSDLWRRYANP
jgi:thymidylate synthase (FAD)